MLDVGWTDAMLCVVHGGAVVYERRIAEAGLCHLFANVTTRLGMAADAAEAVLMSSVDSEDRRQGALAQELRGPFVEYLEVVASELHRSLAYMAHRYQSWQFKRLSISGDGSNITGLREKLTDALQVAVSTGPQPTSIDPALLIAAGAARFSISGTSMKEAA
jgi:Tfp pilus assembly PilM family ATPase